MKFFKLKDDILPDGSVSKSVVKTDDDLSNQEIVNIHKPGETSFEENPEPLKTKDYIKIEASEYWDVYDFHFHSLLIV